MKNLHLLPTNDYNNLVHNNVTNKLELLSGYIKSNVSYTVNHIYITDDSEIKEGDWFYDDDGELCKYTHEYAEDPSNWGDNKKIILTTNLGLITDGVQSIDDEFLEWFVNNPSCQYGGYKDIPWDKIITPKESPIINSTTLVVREAMKIVSEDVREPKCVREGIVKKEPKDVYFNNLKRNNMIPTADEFYNEDSTPLENMIEFAKIHVQAALKEASEKVQLNMYKKSQYSKTPRWKRVSNEEEKEGVDLLCYECQWKPSKKSILNSYPLENIK